MVPKRIANDQHGREIKVMEARQMPSVKNLFRQVGVLSDQSVPQQEQHGFLLAKISIQKAR